MLTLRNSKAPNALRLGIFEPSVPARDIAWYLLIAVLFQYQEDMTQTRGLTNIAMEIWRHDAI